MNMNESQRQSLLGAIAISSGAAGPGNITPQQRSDAFANLEQFKVYNGRMAACVEMIECSSLQIASAGNASLDVTVPGKLYALGVMQEFLKAGYKGLSESDRVQLRSSILLAARQLAARADGTSMKMDDSTRILAVKTAALLSDLALREFPQRWPTLVTDLFYPVSKGGLWCEPGAHAGASTTGVKICLECFKLITEDCTDSDYNARISTVRRNDILLGMNEMSNQILPPLFELLLKQYSDVSNARSALSAMDQYLSSNGRTVTQMSPDEQAQYQQQKDKRDAAGVVVADVLGTLEKFCQSMPLDWMFKVENGIDFVAALLHLLQEDVGNIQVLSVACLRQLSMRKLDQNQWLQLISSLPAALFVANDAASQRANERGISLNSIEVLVEQLEFYRSLSRSLSLLVSAHLAHITTDKDISSGTGPKFEAVSNYLLLLSEMLLHPSPVVCGEQINMWVGLLRDPAIVRTNVLSTHIQRVLASFMNHIVRIRWEDVWEQKNPYSALMEASWDDDEDYNDWLGNLRSKCSQLFRSIGSTEPEIAVNAVHSKFRTLVNSHCYGEPRDALNPKNNELTARSTACLQFEGISQPLENILHGLPCWSIDNGTYDEKRSRIRSAIRPLLSEVANMIVSWDPNDTWLKFRRTALLESLKHYWKYEPSTLPTGIDSLLIYLSAQDNPPTEWLSEDVIGLRKKCGVSLVAVSKVVPHLLVPWLSQLSDRAKGLLTSGGLSPINEMHLYEFLSCVATAVDNPADRSIFVADVLSNATKSLELPHVQSSIQSTEGLLSFMGIMQAGNDPGCVTDREFVKKVKKDFSMLFSSFNQMLSVGKRCREAARKRPNAGLPVQNLSPLVDESLNFPDEGPVCMNDLAINDPFVPLWPKLLPILLQVLDVVLSVWHPECQSALLCNVVQRYSLAISDDEAFLATKQESSVGGVFGKGGTAGSIVSGTHRREMNLTPKWSGWFNELRNNCFQLLGLLCSQRVIYAPEMSHLFPRLVSIITNPEHLRSMEHRHFTQFLKQFIEIMMLSCPVPLYQTHLNAILGPIFEHLQFRLHCSWDAIIGTGGVSSESTMPLFSANCAEAANQLARVGVETWLVAYYARCGLFLGDLDDSVAGEAMVEKSRVELTRTFADMLQSVLALKGGWALVLANKAKEEQAVKKNDPTKLVSGPKSGISDGIGPVNADGTKRTIAQLHLDARKLLRIDKLCHFLLLENEQIAGYLVLTLIQCLEYPDAYTCRRCTRIVHRVLETVAWVDRYTEMLGYRLFSVAVKAIITEPKWMIGIEWDMINIIRDIYGRLVLGQYYLPGGQGPGLQQSRDSSNLLHFEQTKVVDKPLQGGGILATSSDFPRRIIMEIGTSQKDVLTMEKQLMDNRSAKEQKETLRDLLRVAAERTKGQTGVLERAGKEESLLHQSTRNPEVTALPEKLLTYSMIKKTEEKNAADTSNKPWHGNIFQT